MRIWLISLLMDVTGGLTRKTSDHEAFFIAIVLILFLKEKRPGFQSEKQSVLNGESEGKRKSAITYVTALFFLVAGTGISSIAFRMDLGGA